MEKEQTRSQIEEKYKWDLTRLYKNEEEFNKEKQELIKKIEELEKFKGKITSNSDNLYKFLKLDEEVMVHLYNLYLYASCKNHEDVSNIENQKRYNEILNIEATYNSNMSFTMPEFMKTPYEVIKKYIEEKEELKEFEFDLENIYKYQKYTKSDNEELLISNLSEVRQDFENNFEIILNSIMDFGTIKDEENNEVKLTIGNYSKYIKSKDRRVRKEAYIKKGEALKKFANLISTDYSAVLKIDSMVAKSRGYKSDLEMYLYSDGMTEEIYDNLLEVADKNIDKLHKYYKLIKEITGIEEMEAYDITAPLAEMSNKKYLPEDAKNIIIDALSVLGEDYVNVIKKAFEERWIDFYPNKGKRSGYYENTAFRGNPIVLGNYNDDFQSVSAIIHELGHAVHSYYSNKNQPAHLAMYSIFVAEVASLTNEMILSNYIINNSKDINTKLLAIENILSVFASNFFGTLCDGSKFERKVHDRVFKGEPLSSDDFNLEFLKTQKRKHADIIKDNEYQKYGWARVPHFYSSFYYYKYSIGVACACYNAKRIIAGDEKFIEKYLNFLTLGASKMPLDELKTIDIDLLDGKVIEEAINYFDSLIDKYKELSKM